MTVLNKFTSAASAADAMDTLNNLLPQGKFTATPVALRTPINLSTLMQSTTMTAFAPISALPGTAIFVDPSDLYQQMHGAGAALTESTCYVLGTNCTPAQRRAALQAAFGDDGFSTSRICIGTSDFTHRGTGGYYTYADNDDGSDLTLPNFTIQKDLEYIVPVLREALSINPRLKFIASPWSPPKFMKTINSLIGTVGGVVNRFNGTANNFTAYANYFVKFLKAYKALGIPVWAVTIQNEPHYGPDSYPGCVWSGVDMAAFIKILGPALANAGLGSVRILTGDMNWKATTGYNGANGDLLLNVWADTTAAGYCAGSAWHGYNTGGPVNGQHEFEDQRAKNWINREIHFTEMCAVGALSNSQILQQHLANAIIGGIRAGASSVTFWNLFLQPLSNSRYQPFAPNYAQVAPCATISTDGNGTMVKRSDYMALAHLLRAMQPGARRCGSTTFGVGETDTDVQSVAFVNQDGSVGVLLYNNGSAGKTISLVDAPTGFASVLTIAAGDIVSVNYVAPRGAVSSVTLPVPGAVTALSAASVNAINTLTWTAPAAPDASGLGGFLIRRGIAAGEMTQTVGAAGPGATTFADIDVVSGTQYFYQVFAIAAGGLSATSPEANVVTSSVVVTPVSISGTPSRASVGTPYTFTPTTANGSGTKTFALTGALPGGLSFSTSTGSITGTPTTSGTTSGLNITVTDTSGSASLGAFSLVVNAAGVPAKPGPGLLVSDDIGQGVATALNAVPDQGWSNSSFTFSPATSTVTAHNTVAGPDGSTLDASTIRLNSTSTSSGYPSVECATTANTGNVPVTGSVYLRGKVGGERLQLKMFGTVNSGGNVHNPDLGSVQITLTTSWAKYSITAMPPASSKAIIQIGVPNLVEDASFDAAWANVA